MSAAPSNESFANPFPVILIGGVHGTSTVLLNGISLLMIFRNQEIPGRVKICFIGQVFTDLAVGVATMMMILDNFEGIYCYISLYLNYIFKAITSFMTLLQTVDRFLVLRITYAYTAWMSKKKMAAIVIILYVICSAASFGTMYRPADKTEICYPTTSGRRYGYVLFITTTFFCSLSIICLYIYIGIKVRRIQKFSAEQKRIQSRLQTSSHLVHVSHLVNTEHKIQADINNEQAKISQVGELAQNGAIAVGTENCKEINTDGLSKNVIVPENNTDTSKRNQMKETKPRNSPESANDMKVLITMILTASLYGICYIPLASISVFTDIYWDTREDFAAEHSFIFTACGILITSNSLLNPLVYIWRLKSFRVNCKTICSK